MNKYGLKIIGGRAYVLKNDKQVFSTSNAYVLRGYFEKHILRYLYIRIKQGKIIYHNKTI